MPASRPGGRLFANLNCAACHTPPEAAAAPAAAAADAGGSDSGSGGNSAGQEGGNAAVFPRVPLDCVAAKYQPEALKQYLLKPEGHYAWNPMPELPARATPRRRNWRPTCSGAPPASRPPRPRRRATPPTGRSSSSRPAASIATRSATHKSGLKAPALADIPKDGWDKGCLAKDDAARKVRRTTP